MDKLRKGERCSLNTVPVYLLCARHTGSTMGPANRQRPARQGNPSPSCWWNLLERDLVSQVF